ncbi:hypothetical protein CXB51_011039 [Gossypium anomalum]|uniref:Aminotransferase-like plant mobile domain-containing protein n=1 Tax=Gossypium anomalum TaxID=47600 RepID=A0A8J5YVC3_9ROSI|nr:hypothetical protein CXB51_011039 [Gossypium anomalum]
MAGSLIRLDKKHISVDQMTMSVDRVLQCYIRNMPGPPLPLIENYLQETERWRPETHTFHLPCGECTITSKDVQLQLRLPVDGYAVTGSAQSADWGSYATSFWVLFRIKLTEVGSRWQHCTGRCARRRDRIKPKLEDAYHYYNHGHGFAFHFYVLEWNYWVSYVGIPTSLEDIWLLLDQRSEAQFQWTPYEDPAIRPSDRVLRQFRFRKLILVEPKVLDDEHKINLQLLNTDCPRHWSEYIEMRENRYDYIPTREPIIVPELACVPEYMPWFRIHGKSYLLSEEERRRQICVPRERRGPLNLRRMDDDAGPSAAPTQSPGPSTAPTQPPGPTLQPTTPISQPFQIMPVLWQVGMHVLVHLRSQLLRVNRRSVGHRRTRDRRSSVGELFFLPIPIALWDSNTSAMGDANTSALIILSRWVILPAPTTRYPAGGTTISTGVTTTLAGS